MAFDRPVSLPTVLNGSVFDRQRDSRNPRAVSPDQVSPLSSNSEESVDGLEAGFAKKSSPKFRYLKTVIPPGLKSSRPKKTTFAFQRRKGIQRQPFPKLLIFAIVVSIASMLVPCASDMIGALLTLMFSVLTSLLIYYIKHLRSLITPNDIEKSLASWGLSDYPQGSAVNLPPDFSRGIIPIPCHSHNDYWRHVPLYSALAAGCTSVEADVWLSDADLFVGHSENSLTRERTLTSLYIDPIVSILSIQNTPSQQVITNPISPSSTSPSNAGPNGVFETSPKTPLILLIDIKTDGDSTFPTVLDQLEPLRSRGWLTHFNGTSVIPGPVTVVGTGNTPFDLLTSNSTYRDIFYDAPLEELWGDDPTTPTTAYGEQLLGSERYTVENSYYASVSFQAEIGSLWHGTLTPQQVLKIRGQVKGATERRLKARYWETPAWPVGRRDHVWDVLMREDVGSLNVDDLEGAKERNWGG